SLAVATFETDGTRVTIVDTPGYLDFVAEVISGFAAAEGAILVTDATGGVEAGLEQAVTLGRSTNTAACFFINKCDKENADPTAALDALRSTFGNKIAPLQLAIGAAHDFTGYVDLVHRKAYTWEDGKESILAPVLVGSSATGVGLQALLDAIVRYLPSPADEGPTRAIDKSGATVEVPPDPNGPLLARVFKTAADPFVGRLTYLRVLSGTLKSQGHAWNSTRGEDERIGQLLLLHGKEQEPIGELRAGEIGAVAKLSVTETDA